MPQTKTYIKTLLENTGISPLKRFGQHFMIDGNLMNKLIAAADIQKNDVVLEVGPGTGSLTERLLEVTGRVIAVEIDNTLFTICSKQFAGHDKLSLIHGDILHTKSSVSKGVLRQLDQHCRSLGGRVLLVANLPYQIATPLIIDLLMDDLKVSPLCFTVQAEVGERIMALPDNKAFGPISVLAQAMAEVKIIARVPAQAFWPRPKVESMMIKLDVNKKDTIPSHTLQQLARIVHGCFNHRRKTMHKNLRNLLDEHEYQNIIQSEIINLNDRPENITVEQWIEMAKRLTGQ